MNKRKKAQKQSGSKPKAKKKVDSKVVPPLTLKVRAGYAICMFETMKKCDPSVTPLIAGDLQDMGEQIKKQLQEVQNGTDN